MKKKFIIGTLLRCVQKILTYYIETIFWRGGIIMRKTTQDKRKKFVKTTEELFYKSGYKDTSIKDICEALETTTGSFYFMFDSKEGILEEIVKGYYEKFLDDVDTTLDAGKDLKEKIGAWVKLKYEYYNLNGEFFVMYDNLASESGRASLVINDAEETRTSRTKAAVEKLIKENFDELSFDKDRTDYLVNLVINIEELRAKDIYNKLKVTKKIDIKKEIEFSTKILLNLLGL